VDRVEQRLIRFGVCVVTRSVLRRLVVVVVVLGAVAMVAAEAASATSIEAHVSVQGAGQVASSSILFGVLCDRTGNVDDRVTVDCGTTIVGGPDEPPNVTVPLILFAGPRTGTGAQAFVRWEGCDTAPQIDPCRFTAPPGTDRTVFPKAVFDDSTPPTATLGAPSFSDTVDGTVRFPALAADERPAALECSVDNGAFAPCTPATTFRLNEGSHEVRARARDASGNVGLSAPAPVRVLDTRLVSGPPDFAASTTATFTASTLEGVTFECSLDGAAFAGCGAKGADGRLTRRLDNLAAGAHTFRIRARDGADFDRVPIVRTWTVDTVPPETVLALDVGPREGEVTTLLTAAFAISTSEPATLECRLAPAAFAPCGARVSLADLPFGQNRFEVRAVDRAGNVDRTQAARTWTVSAADRDGDGVNQRGDCDDGDATIRPGRPEVRGNAVDEDCDGVAAPFPTLRVTVSYNFRAAARSTTLTRLQVKDVPRGAKVTATCAFKRSKCPGKARRPFRVRRAAGTVSLNRRYKGVSLRVGTTITVTVTRPRSIGAVKRLEIRRSKPPKVTDRCLPPGAQRPSPCSREPAR
jgi:hypothetical protein